MGVIVPAVLVPSRAKLDETLARVDGLVDAVQVDIVDGRCVGPATWPFSEPAELEQLRKGGQFPRLASFTFEVDLMVERPEDEIGLWIDAGATRLLAHVESVRSMEKL